MTNNNIFTRKQQEQIDIGKERGIDTSIYAKPRFSHKQMEQIRMGLEDNLDVSKYASPKYSYSQMDEIRRELLMESSKEDDNYFWLQESVARSVSDVLRDMY